MSGKSCAFLFLVFILYISHCRCQNEELADATTSPTSAAMVTAQGQDVNKMAGREPSSPDQMPSTSNQPSSANQAPIETSGQEPSASAGPGAATAESNNNPSSQGQNANLPDQSNPDAQAPQGPTEEAADRDDCYVSCRLIRGTDGAALPAQGTLLPTDIDHAHAAVAATAAAAAVPVAVPAYHPYYWSGYAPFAAPWPVPFGPRPFGPGPWLGRWKRQAKQNVDTRSKSSRKPVEAEKVFKMEMNGSMYSCQKIC